MVDRVTLRKIASIRKMAEEGQENQTLYDLGDKAKDTGLGIWEKMKELGNKAKDKGGEALGWAEKNPITAGAALGAVPALAVALAAPGGSKLKSFLWTLAAGVPLGIGGMYAWNTWNPNARAVRSELKEDKAIEAAKRKEEADRQRMGETGLDVNGILVPAARNSDVEDQGSYDPTAVIENLPED